MLDKSKVQRLMWDRNITLLDVRASADMEASTFMRLGFRRVTILDIEKKTVNENGQKKEKFFYNIFNPSLEAKGKKKYIKGKMGVIYLFEYTVTNKSELFDTKQETIDKMKEKSSNDIFFLSPIAEHSIHNI